ncbi:MAG: hypothetical protein EOP24_36135 [Hyphomicrobiales bacterium]|nr:MAG: hypothetical protein EOP24_36135 [Hyphomicrobiales bacterium]
MTTDQLIADLSARVAELEEWRRTALGYPIWKAGDTFLGGYTAGYRGKLWTSTALTKQEPGTGSDWVPFVHVDAPAAGAVAH